MAVAAGMLITLPLAEACPACVVSRKDVSNLDNFIILSVMGIVPLVIGFWVFYKVSSLQKNERKQRS